jgi:predicted nucleotidyltransferase
LTSALTNEAVVAKKSQMEVLTEFLVRVQDKIKSNIFIAGDFNLTTSSYTIEAALSQGIITKVTEESIKSVIDPNFWEDIFDHVENLVEDGGQELYEGEEGATFDRLSNPLAPYTEATIGHRPQRYDRVLYKKFDGINPQNLRNFGMPTAEGQCGSDHYGVCATFCIEESGSSPQNATATSIAVKELRSGNISIIEDTTNVESLLEPYLPTSEDEKRREDSITALRQIFNFKDDVGQFVFAPMGSQCLGTYLNDSDIDILVIGSTTPQKFFEFAEMRLHAKEEGNEVSGIRSSISSLVPIIKFALRGIEFDLQYCQAPALVER